MNRVKENAEKWHLQPIPNHTHEGANPSLWLDIEKANRTSSTLCRSWRVNKPFQFSKRSPHKTALRTDKHLPRTRYTKGFVPILLVSDHEIRLCCQSTNHCLSSFARKSAGFTEILAVWLYTKLCVLSTDSSVMIKRALFCSSWTDAFWTEKYQLFLNKRGKKKYTITDEHEESKKLTTYSWQL